VDAPVRILGAVNHQRGMAQQLDLDSKESPRPLMIIVPNNASERLVSQTLIRAGSRRTYNEPVLPLPSCQGWGYPLNRGYKERCDSSVGVEDETHSSQITCTQQRCAVSISVIYATD
jgi:hypothetical protein